MSLECNQYAWLVSNTYGDFDEALRCGLKSVEIYPYSTGKELDPNIAGKLDTLGRCYWAKGDLEEAIKVQSKALKLDPHGGLIKRQLRFFEKELAAKQAAEIPKP